MSVMRDLEDKQQWTSLAVTFRSFQRSDQSECLKIYIDGFQEFSKDLCFAFLSTLS